MTPRPFPISGSTLAKIVATGLVAAAIIAIGTSVPAGIAATYLRLGIEHILFGFDHLLFVLALVLLVRDWRRVALAVTTFAVAHSITLAVATLGVVKLHGTLVEAAIALSILLVAVEIVNARRGRFSLADRWPSIVAFCFGLLHGFGFAGALAEVGLPDHTMAALLFFNLGIEIGQLAFVAAIMMTGEAIRRAMALRLEPALVRGTVERFGVTAACAIGALAVFWLIERTSALLV